MALRLIDNTIIILFSLAFFIVSCEPDPCRSKFCYDGSECVDGICFCLQGQYGDDCSSTYSADVAGTYTVQSICGLDTSIYSSSISTVIDTPWLIRISNPDLFINDTVRMEAIFAMDGTMNIVDSTLNIGGSTVMLSGSTELVSNDSIILQMSYNSESCTETYYR